MPEALDPMRSIGYLIAAAGVTVVGIGGYALLVARRLGRDEQRLRERRSRVERGEQ